MLEAGSIEIPCKFPMEQGKLPLETGSLRTGRFTIRASLLKCVPLAAP